ncbi:MAG: aconitate hydratase [Candidatus Aenigmatarchaeota archaeon]
MGKSVTQKIIESHLVSGHFKPGEINKLKVDQVLLQDATGTMACMEFEMLGIPRVKVDFAIVYIDHNMLQLDHRNPEDHIFLKDFAAKYGIHYSRPGNGICHQVHTERFAKPGILLIGANSHTPTSGAVGCLAIGVGGLDAAIAMAGYPFELETQKIVAVHLTGKLPPWVSSKDIILEMLRKLTVKGGIGKIYEFTGPSVSDLTVTQRATICNMITELGATSAVFPSDEQTRRFLRWQQREEDFIELLPDPDARYDEEMVIELDKLEPLIAKPHSPDNVVPVREVEGTKAVQVCIGSSVNSWYENIAVPAEIVSKGGVHHDLVMTVSPGSRQILNMITKTGVLTKLLLAGARILEPACGPCVGMGQAPPEGGVSVRTFNRNFKGRSGTINDLVYLCSPEVAGATALKGVITDPRNLGDPPIVEIPDAIIDDSLIIKPLGPEEASSITIRRGKNIVPPPPEVPLPERIEGRVLIKLGDNISTGSMAPDGAIVMADRSNVGAIAQYTFMKEDREFLKRAVQWKGGFIVAGHNYGQGSSREHAVLAPKYLGVKGVLAKSYARIHRRNLINHGLIPVIIDDHLYDVISTGSQIVLPAIRDEISRPGSTITLIIDSKSYIAKHDLNPTERAALLEGGTLSLLKKIGPYASA